MLNLGAFLKFPVVYQSNIREEVPGTNGAMTVLAPRQSIEEGYEKLVNINNITSIIELESLEGEKYTRVSLADGSSFPCRWSMELTRERLKEFMRLTIAESARWSFGSSEYNR